MDLLNVMAHAKYGLPARDWIRSNERVNGFKHVADVLGRTALSGEQLEVVGIGSVFETRLRVVCRQGVQEAAQRLGDAIIKLVTRGPEGICIPTSVNHLHIVSASRMEYIPPPVFGNSVSRSSA